MATLGVTMAIASIAASAAGTVAAVAGSEQQAQAQSEQENYAASVARNNAILSQRAATQATLEGQQEQTNRAVADRTLVSAQKAILAGNDNAATPGTSALQLVAGTAQKNEVNEATLRTNATNTADGFIAQGDSFNTAAAQDKLAAGFDLSAGTTSALAAGVGGLGTVADKWYKYKNAGAFNGPGGNA